MDQISTNPSSSLDVPEKIYIAKQQNEVIPPRGDNPSLEVSGMLRRGWAAGPVAVNRARAAREGLHTSWVPSNSGDCMIL